MPFKGPYPTVFSGNTAAMVISHTTFSGGVTNTGTIGAGGISVVSRAFLSGGGIFDSGVIVGGIKVDSSSKIVANGGTTTAIAVENTNTFGGGISNAGLLSAAHHHDGILVGSVSTFSGGIRNRGTIVAGSFGVVVSSATVFTGGITNSGHISNDGGPAIAVENVTSFSGGIVNASGGVINPLHGGINVRGISIFSGGIANSGTILSEDNSGIDVFLVSFWRHHQQRQDLGPVYWHRPLRGHCFRHIDARRRHCQHRQDLGWHWH
jgi:hypothetical protein